MSYVEAETKMASLMKAQRDFWIHNINTNDEISKETWLQYDLLNIHRDKFGEELAANPSFSEIMLSWVVDINGVQCCNIKNIINNLDKICSNEMEIEDLLKQEGGMQQSIITFINQAGFKISGAGGGYSGWHIGIFGNNAETNKFCEFIHFKFRKAISYNLISVRKRFWKHWLPTLYNWDCLDKWISKNGEPQD